MSRDETPEEHDARMKAAMDVADAIIEATRKQPSQDVTVVHGERYGISGGVHHGDVYYSF
ncbi:hypothetical protein OG453_25310 [Streptomyces sp. NBC_01381]|uniref:hypothetical protein n=1 Tax=Streptomyces sp. NBC_01381 TaxID=2903845 RepID=UPI00224EA370|nr:hypothetical protein [Streptomyces sp. NBC_01381]MCX4669967.1 hypothetical protein [Streptomyces sp. NBC_01381]